MVAHVTIHRFVRSNSKTVVLRHDPYLKPHIRNGPLVTTIYFADEEDINEPFVHIQHQTKHWRNRDVVVKRAVAGELYRFVGRLYVYTYPNKIVLSVKKFHV